MQRYHDTVELIKRDTPKRSYETMLYPTFPYLPTDLYIISRKMERMDLLAHEHYGDPRLWWVIQRANNGLAYGSLVIPSGLRIRIPHPYTAYDILEMMKEKQF